MTAGDAPVPVCEPLADSHNGDASTGSIIMVISDGTSTDVADGFTTTNNMRNNDRMITTGSYE